MEGAGVIPDEKLGFCWRTGEGKEEGDGADRRARGAVREGGAMCGGERAARDAGRARVGRHARVSWALVAGPMGGGKEQDWLSAGRAWWGAGPQREEGR